MGITVVLESETGAPIETVADPTNVLHRVLPEAGDSRYRCLSVIDWYGDTVFNHLQAQQFLSEWSEVEQRIGDAKGTDQDLVLAIRKLAEQLQQDCHVYLKFYGD